MSTTRAGGSATAQRRPQRGWRIVDIVTAATIAAAFGAGRLPALPGGDMTSRLTGTNINAPFTDDDPVPTGTAPARRVLDEPLICVPPPTPTGRWPNSTRPASACSSPAIMRSRVDLPDPDSPTRESRLPPGTVRSIPLSTADAPNRLVRPVMVRAGLVMTSIMPDGCAVSPNRSLPTTAHP